MSNRVKISKQELQDNFTILNHVGNNGDYYINDQANVVSKYGLTLLGRSKPGCYAQCHLNGIGNIYCHRLMWIHHNGNIGYMKEIDHINRLKSDNRIENLRCVSVSTNRKNRLYISNGAMKKKIPIVACNNVKIFNFESISSASKALGIGQGMISMSLQKKRYYNKLIALDGSKYEFTKLFDDE